MFDTKKLYFGIGNAKLVSSIATFSLPAGHTCPFAKECLSKSDRISGKITDGPHCRFRCFAATGEARAKTVRVARWHNLELLQNAGSIERMGRVIQKSIPDQMDKVRIHVSGDFFSEKYFLAWLNVAKYNPKRIFYGYTKATPFLINYRKHIPDNLRLTASKGGTCDSLIASHNLHFAEVVFSMEEAQAKGLELDHDDDHAIEGKESFALLIHGTQPVGTEASKAWSKLISLGIGGYNKKRIRRPRVVKNTFMVSVTLNDSEPRVPYQITKDGTAILGVNFHATKHD